jgi:hypothetical protein
VTRLAPSPQISVLDVAIEIATLLTAVFALALVALRGRSLSGGVAAWRPFLPLALAVLLGLLAFRSRRPRAGPHVRAGLAPGRWLARLETPGLLLAGVFFGVLLVLPPGSETLGVDAGAYLEQLGGFFLRGQPGAHPGVEPGAAVLWAPFYLLGHAVAVGARAAGIDVAANGESEPYRNALRLGAAVYGLLAAVFAQRAATRFVRPVLAAVCAAGFWLGSALYHYTVAEPVMAHAPGAAASSLLLLLWIRAREAPERGRRWIAVAFVAGLLVTIQRYDTYLLLPTLLSATAIVRSRWRQGGPLLRRRTVLAVAGAGTAFALAVLPLVLLTLATPDRFLLNPEIIRSQMLSDWARPHIGPLLFSSHSGFFAWTPLALPAVLGLVLLARRDRKVGLTLLLTLALGVYVLASTPTWSAGWSFGARRFTEAYPILVLGLSVGADAALRRPWLPALALLGLLVVQNVLFSTQVRLGHAQMGDAHRFTPVVQGAVADFYATLGHPGSWPANWVFALRYGVTPDRFDEIYGRVPRDRLAMRVGSAEEGAALGRGWSRVEEGETGRWAEGEDATLLPTLTGPADRTLRLRGAAARHPGGLPQIVEVEVNGQQAGRVTLTPEGQSWATRVAADGWRPGLNEIRFRAAWRLSRNEAWAVDQPPFVGWRLEEITIEPVP